MTAGPKSEPRRGKLSQGRHRSLLTREVRGKILAGLQEQLPVPTILACLGIPRGTFNSWYTRYPEFREEVRTARARGEKELIGEIRHAVVSTKDGLLPDWKARAWVAEKVYPEQYGKRLEVQVSGPSDAALEASRDPEYVEAALAKMLTSGASTEEAVVEEETE